MKKIPQLSMTADRKRWVLSLSQVYNDYDLEVHISYCHRDGENPSQYVAILDDSTIGDRRQMVTPETLRELVRSKYDNEGMEVALQWRDNQQEYIAVPEHYIVHSLVEEIKQYWESLLTLNLINPHYTF